MIKLFDIVKTILKEQKSGPLSPLAKKNISDMIRLNQRGVDRNNMDDIDLINVRELSNVKTYEELLKLLQNEDFKATFEITDVDALLADLETEDDF
jgi:hypothetical protein